MRCDARHSKPGFNRPGSARAQGPQPAAGASGGQDGRHGDSWRTTSSIAVTGRVTAESPARVRPGLRSPAVRQRQPAGLPRPPPSDTDHRAAGCVLPGHGGQVVACRIGRAGDGAAADRPSAPRPRPGTGQPVAGKTGQVGKRTAGGLGDRPVPTRSGRRGQCGQCGPVLPLRPVRPVRSRTCAIGDRLLAAAPPACRRSGAGPVGSPDRRIRAAAECRRHRRSASPAVRTESPSRPRSR